MKYIEFIGLRCRKIERAREGARGREGGVQPLTGCPKVCEKTPEFRFLTGGHFTESKSTKAQFYKKKNHDSFLEIKLISMHWKLRSIALLVMILRFFNVFNRTQIPAFLRSIELDVFELFYVRLDCLFHWQPFHRTCTIKSMKSLHTIQHKLSI